MFLKRVLLGIMTMAAMQHILNSSPISDSNNGAYDTNNTSLSGSLRSLNLLSKRHEIHVHDVTFDTNAPLPWDCGVEYVWRDLGDRHYPRHIREARCGNTSCYFGHFSCVPNIYNIRVLTPNFHSRVDGKIPISMRSDWVFRDIRVTVGCQCSRDIFH